MKNTKKTNKKVNPAFTVDISKCQDANDMLLAFAYAKQEAGLPITNEELDAIIDDNMIIVVLAKRICDCNCSKKKPWYKRFWNWLTRKK